MIKIGDTVVVGYQINDKFVSSPFSAKVALVHFDSSICRTQIDLDWGTLGKSKVYLDDENKVWKQIGKHN
jgi:hypothetical protein